MVKARGLCNAHWLRLRRRGTLDPVKPRPIGERLWGKVVKTDACWIWSGAKNNKGYGQIQLGGRGVGIALTHRVVFELENGPVPVGMCVMHTCDQPACVRPDHLVLGTVAENNADMRRKNRGIAGERHPKHRLTAADIACIRTSARAGVSARELASDFAVKANTINGIVAGRSWKSVGL